MNALLTLLARFFDRRSPERRAWESAPGQCHGGPLDGRVLSAGPRVFVEPTGSGRRVRYERMGRDWWFAGWVNTHEGASKE